MKEYQDERRKLQLEADRYLAKLESDLRISNKKSRDAGIGTLLIGGALFLLYIAGKRIFQEAEPKIEIRSGLEYPLVLKVTQEESIVARKIRDYITIFLLSLIKQRILAYINESTPRHEPVQQTS